MAQYKTYATLSERNPERDYEREEKVLTVKSEDHRKQLIAHNPVVVIYNYADWCAPCKEIVLDYVQLSGMYTKPNMCAVVKEDVDAEIGNTPEPVHAVPCFHFYLKGRYQKDLTVTGANLSDVESHLKQLIEKAQPAVPRVYSSATAR